jgi:hypothetical protein
VPYYSKLEKENKMTKKYRTKQTVINEQNEKIENLEDKIRFAGYREDTHKRMLTHEARKFSDIICPVASITVCEDTYRPVEEPATVLANIQVYEEIFDDEVGGEMKTDLLKEMDKLSEALSSFYSVLSCDIRINMSINRY